MTSPDSRIFRTALSLPVTYAAPRTSTEQGLADIWCSVLHMDCVGVHDNYFDLGGDSIMAAAMFVMVLEKFSIAISTATLIDTLTIAKLAGAIDRMTPPTGLAPGAAPV